MDILLNGKVGIPPSSQSELDGLIDDGESRYECKIPPGFADNSKEKNPENETFYHDGIAYPKKFGDLILWKQILNHCRDEKISCVLFVTADRKDDWWWKERGKVIGPRPELYREFKSFSDVDLFWMYSSAQFLQNATKFTTAEVSDKSVDDLKSVINQYSEVAKVSRDSDVAENFWRGQHMINSKYGDIERAVFKFLVSMHGKVLPNLGFPDFLVPSDNGIIGYEVKFLRHLPHTLATASLVETIDRGYKELLEGKIKRFILVLVIEWSPAYSKRVSEDIYVYRHRIRNFLEDFPVDEVLLGYVDDFGTFVLIIGEMKSDELRR